MEHMLLASESAWYQDSKQTGMGALNAQWGSGLWWGKIDSSDGYLIATASGVTAARTIQRKPPSQRWDEAEYREVNATPWTASGTGAATVVMERSRYVTKAMVNKYGKTKGCQHKNCFGTGSGEVQEAI